MGPIESLCFLRLPDPGSGDYTDQRQTRLEKDTTTVAELSATIRGALPPAI